MIKQNLNGLTIVCHVARTQRSLSLHRFCFCHGACHGPPPLFIRQTHSSLSQIEKEREKEGRRERESAISGFLARRRGHNCSQIQKEVQPYPIFSDRRFTKKVSFASPHSLSKVSWTLFYFRAPLPLLSLHVHQYFVQCSTNSGQF